MSVKNYKWKIVGKKLTKLSDEQIIKRILENRGLSKTTQRREFLNPKQAWKYSLTDLGVSPKDVKKATSRIKDAIKKEEEIIIFGDYDSDGVCATAVFWEFLYSLNKNVLPYLPDRFSEGYGISAKVISKIKKDHPGLSLIITVDNGIVSFDAVDKARELGIDTIITDHHKKDRKLPKANCIIHTTETSGAGIAWLFSKEISKALDNKNINIVKNTIEVAAIGVVSDQVPLLGFNRSIVKYGLIKLNKTDRVGILALLAEAGLRRGEINIYDVNFIIAPRINAMGRLKHAIESLRLLCTKDSTRAVKLARNLGITNRERQKTTEDVLIKAKKTVESKSLKSAIVIAGTSYHEGVIGLAAAKLVEEFGRPAVVISKGKDISKASARSIAGINIIEVIRQLSDLIEDGGGHSMAAGFSLKTENIAKFKKNFQKKMSSLITKELLEKRMKIDLEIDFSQISLNLLKLLKNLEPSGVGNPKPLFLTKDIVLKNVNVIGRDGKHLRMHLQKNDLVFKSVAFGFGDFFTELGNTEKTDVVYCIEEDNWNGAKKIQLKIRDIKLLKKSRLK